MTADSAQEIPQRIIVGHPTMNSNSRQVALAFAERGMLAELHTSFDTTRLASLIQRGQLGRALERRRLPAAVHAQTRAHPLTELRRLVRRDLSPLSKPTSYLPDMTAHSIDRAVARRLDHGSFDAVYSYEDSALASFEAASAHGIRKIYDLPIGYWRAGRRILDEERVLNPSWADTLPGASLPNQDERLARKEHELQSADHVIVASTFTARTLHEAPNSPRAVSIVPYGAPTVHEGGWAPSGKKLRVLYVGALTQRKGLSYLFEAVQQLGSAVELTLIGRKLRDAPILDLAVKSHRWIPSLNHASVLSEMRAHDLLVFPSLFEGFGLVLTEALSQGLPVLATDHTAAPDLIDDGVQGWVVPIRSSDLLAERMELALADKPMHLGMRHAALARAKDLQWGKYRDQLRQTVEGSQ